jgi:predicted Zn-dependent protease
MRFLTLLAVACAAVTAAACEADKAPRAGDPDPEPTRTPIQRHADIAPTPDGIVGEPPQTGAAQEPVVYLLPLDDFPQETVDRLQAFFQDEHGIAVGSLPSIRIDDSAYDPARAQLVADDLLDALDAARGPRRDVVVIGLTEYDMYMLDMPRWNWVFSLRDERGLAVVSVSHMDPRNFGYSRDDDLLFERASKMVGKNIGVLHLGLPASEDPRSVMYNSLVSVNALDAIDDNFRLVASP